MSNFTSQPAPVATPMPALPSLAVILSQIQNYLTSEGQLGLLSVTVLGREGEHGSDRWVHYEAILQEISVFLRRFAGRRMRSSDILLDPIVAGNTFVVMLGPPREERKLNRTDVVRVRHRLLRGLKRHLRSSLPQPAVERYGVYVGGALVRHDPTVEASRIIYHGLEQAFADALGQRKREVRRQTLHLQRILRGEQISTVYQPLVNVFERRVIGFEALTRMPNRQFPTPELLFKIAYENGALWAVERLCRKRAVESVPKIGSDQRLFLNIEPDSFGDPELLGDEFLQQLERAGLEPSRVVLEWTEHAAVKDFTVMRRTLEAVRSVGFRLAMDDVGSGYSGLQTIAEIRPDYLKVDMSLVRDLHRDPIKRELIETIRRFSDSTGITLVAEGVESQEELESLASVGVRCAQGYLFAKPDSPPRKPDWQLVQLRQTGQICP
jgi:EAL domain-containing protein (putative c-di-GMP-specific phosphodiesterase class I)